MFTKALIFVLLGSALVVSSDAGFFKKVVNGTLKRFNKFLNHTISFGNGVKHGAAWVVGNTYELGKKTAGYWQHRARDALAYVEKLGENGVEFLEESSKKVGQSAYAAINATVNEGKIKIQKLIDAGKAGTKFFADETEKIIKETQESIGNIVAASGKPWSEGEKNEKETPATPKPEGGTTPITTEATPSTSKEATEKATTEAGIDKDKEELEKKSGEQEGEH